MGKADTKVLETLAWLGAPLAGYRPARRLPTEDALLQGLKLARRNATVLKVFPLVFARLAMNPDLDLDWNQFLSKVSAAGDAPRRELGLVLEMAAKLGHSTTLEGLARRLHRARDSERREYFFAEPGPRNEELARLRSPREARRWGFFLNMPEDSFRSLFEKFSAQVQPRPA